jgi:hypothetical protein
MNETQHKDSRVDQGATTLSITTPSITTLSIATLSKATLSITTSSKTTLIKMTLCIAIITIKKCDTWLHDTQQNGT